MIIYITRSLTDKVISSGQTNSSSQLFELGLVQGLAKKMEVNVINLGSENRAQQEINKIYYNEVNYKNNIFGFLFLIYCLFLVKSKRNKKGGVFVFHTGYNTVDIISIFLFRLISGVSNYCFIYDTHKQGVKFLGWLRKNVLKIYFSIGRYIALRSTGLIVLNDLFLKKIKQKPSYCKIRVGAIVNSNNNDFIINNKFKNTDVFLFAGTLNDENGIGLAIEYLRFFPNKNVEFHFYGDGFFSNAVEKLALVDNRVKYFGRVQQALLKEKMILADFLVNLRDPEGESSQYSFPSKLIDFMATGVPVISNIFPGLDSTHSACLLLMSDFSIKDFSTVIDRSIQMPKEDRVRLGYAGKEVVSNLNNWDCIANEIIEFVGNNN